MTTNGIIKTTEHLGAQIAALAGDGYGERTTGGYYIRLTRINLARRLIIGRRDRAPSYDEIEAIGLAAGAPAGCEPQSTICTITTQDGSIVRLYAVVIGWRQI